MQLWQSIAARPGQFSNGARRWASRIAWAAPPAANRVYSWLNGTCIWGVRPMTVAQAVTPPAYFASCNLCFLGVAVTGADVEFVYVTAQAGTSPSLRALIPCVLVGQL